MGRPGPSPRRLLLIVGTVFTVVGLACLSACAWLVVDTVQFRSTAVGARGEIVDVRSRIRCQDRCRRLYSPVVRFTTASGRPVTVDSSGWSSHRPRVGDTVAVRYPPGRPAEARIDSFIDSWLAPLVVGAVGVGLGVPGGAILLVRAARHRKDAWLTVNGRRVSAEITGIRPNPNLRINGVRPYQVHAGWLDPADGRRYAFTSNNLVTDPRALLGDRRTVDVIIDPADPAGRYRLDLPVPESQE